MEKFGFIGVVFVLLGGCGSAAKNYPAAYGPPPAEPTAEYGRSYEEAAAPEVAPYDAELSSPAASFDGNSADYAVRNDGYEASGKKDGTRISAPSTGMGSPPPAPPGGEAGDAAAQPAAAQPVPTQEESMVVYSGYLQLRVKRLLDAVAQITEMVEKRGGYIDSLTPTAVVVRIPGKDFEEAMQTLATVGDLMDRWVRAEDVTAQFTDLKARLAVAEEARARLLKLLEKVSNVAERLRILQEIKRLSEMIDTIDSTLAAIRNLVDYFTITVDLVPVLEVERVDTGLSPFAWVRELKPHVQSLWEGDGAVSMQLPKGFVLFDEQDTFRAQAADTSIIRAATTKNEPRGDNKFWMDAVDFEMSTRREKIIESGEVGKAAYRVYENDDVTPRFYLTAILTKNEKIYVIEVFYPNKEAFDLRHGAVLEALKTVEVK